MQRFTSGGNCHQGIRQPAFVSPDTRKSSSVFFRLFGLFACLFVCLFVSLKKSLVSYSVSTLSFVCVGFTDWLATATRVLSGVCWVHGLAGHSNTCPIWRVLGSRIGWPHQHVSYLACVGFTDWLATATRVLSGVCWVHGLAGHSNTCPIWRVLGSRIGWPQQHVSYLACVGFTDWLATATRVLSRVCCTHRFLAASMVLCVQVTRGNGSVRLPVAPPGVFYSIV